jgi:hypothetical protein
MVDFCVVQRFHMSDVPIETFDSTPLQLGVDNRVEVDHQDVIE